MILWSLNTSRLKDASEQSESNLGRSLGVTMCTVLQAECLIMRVPRQVPEQVRTQHSNQFWTNNENILRLVIAIGLTQLSVKEMMSAVNLKHRPNFLEYTLNPAIEGGWVRMLYPESPRHPRQKYLLTVKGMGLYNKMNPTN